ncbi:MAG: isoamylase early set domain-containing protein [Gemmatimonadaceae bacterium]
MADRDPLPLVPAEADDPALVARLTALYAATPLPPEGQAEQCARAVLARAMHQPVRAADGVPRIRWWWGAAAAAILVLGVRITTTRDRTGVPAPATATPELAGTVTPTRAGLRFEIQLPDAAQQVALVGDFNGWSASATPMVRRGPQGGWAAEIPLTPGRHEYAFVVDGRRWVIDPLAPQVPDAGFGPSNAVVVEGGSE